MTIKYFATVANSLLTLALLVNATGSFAQSPPTGQDKVRLERFDKEVDELHGDETKDRNTAWQEDLIVARDVFLPKDRSYSPEARRAARDEIERTLSRIGKLTDQEVVASLARAAALSD